MLNKKAKSTRYISHVLNTSDTKTTYSFSKGSRFQRISSQTPNKFYDYNNTKNKRSASMGYGKKLSLLNKFTGDPGLYTTKGLFQQIKSKQPQAGSSTFGESHIDIFSRTLNQIKTPGPGQYYPQQFKTKSKFYIGRKVNIPDSTKATINLGPTTYAVDSNYLERLSKFRTTQSFRIRTQYPVRSKLQFLCPPGPGAYNPQKILALAQNSKSRFSNSPVCFSRSERLKDVEKKNSVGPGSYKLFSVFGDQNY